MKRRVFIASVLAVGAAFPLGCTGDDADRTGDETGGIGAAGKNATDAPQSQEEIRKRQLEEEAAFQKSRRK